VVPDGAVLAHRDDVRDLYRRSERLAAIQGPGGEDGRIRRRDAVQRECRPDLPSHEHLDVGTEHRHGTLLERTRVAAVRDRIGLLRSRNGWAQPCVPTIPWSPDLNLADAIL